MQAERILDFLGNSAALLGVMQGRDTKPGAEETSKTVLRKFPRKSFIKRERAVFWQGVKRKFEKNSIRYLTSAKDNGTLLVD